MNNNQQIRTHLAELMKLMTEDIKGNSPHSPDFEYEYLMKINEFSEEQKIVLQYLQNDLETAKHLMTFAMTTLHLVENKLQSYYK